jgi:hypothetical protein
MAPAIEGEKSPGFFKMFVIIQIIFVFHSMFILYIGIEKAYFDILLVWPIENGTKSRIKHYLRDYSLTL